MWLLSAADWQSRQKAKSAKSATFAKDTVAKTGKSIERKRAMADEPEAVTTVSAAQAMTLLLLEAADLKRLERAGAFRPIAPGKYGLVELVQGFARHVRKPDGPALVSSAALGKHFDCAPAYVRKLVEQGVIERKSDGRYDLDACRSKYLAHLRAERKLSPKGAADTEFTAAKAELIRIRIAEKKRELVRQSDVDELIDSMMGALLSALSSLPAQAAPVGDLPMRRRLEQWVFRTRKALATDFERMGDEAGEPPLEDAA
jgi:hypothetical protein